MNIIFSIELFLISFSLVAGPFYGIAAYHNECELGNPINAFSDRYLCIGCDPSGRTDLKVEWYTSNGNLISGNNKFEIRRVGDKDAGNYNCTVLPYRNFTRNFTIHVHGSRTEVYFLEKPIGGTVKVGNSYNLTCLGSKAANSIIWYKGVNFHGIPNGESPDDYIDKIIDEAADKSTLELHNLSHDDKGWYSCIIKSKNDSLKRANASAYIDVVDPENSS